MADRIKDFGWGARRGSPALGEPMKFTPYMGNRVTIYPDDIPSNASGKELNRRMGALINRQVIGIQTGDPSYTEQLKQHYLKSPLKAYRDSNTQKPSARSIETYYRSTTPVGRAPGGSWYDEQSGTIGVENSSYIKEVQTRLGLRTPTQVTSRKYIGLPQGVFNNSLVHSYNFPISSIRGLSFGHELIHAGDLGRLQYKPKPAQRPGVPTLIRANYMYRGTTNTTYQTGGTPRPPVTTTPEQLSWIQAHRMDPYDYNPTELSQGQQALNRYQRGVQLSLMKNRQKLINQGFSGELIDQYLQLPVFLKADSQGLQQFHQRMQFYQQHPEFAELLGPEGKRFPASYHNIQRATIQKPNGQPYANSPADQKQKQFFEGLMKGLENRRFLGYRGTPTHSRTVLQS